MFRVKKASETDSQSSVLAPRQESTEEPPVANPPPRRTLPMLPRTADHSSSPEATRRSVLAAPARAEAGAASDKTLVVGKEVRIKGEISACDRMILEGDAEIALADTRHLQIGASGRFRGTAEVAEADVGGHFEGDLVVRERLTVRPTGRIRGNIRYAQITVEAGGQIIGEMTMLDAGATPTRGPQAARAAGVGGNLERAVSADQP